MLDKDMLGDISEDYLWTLNVKKIEKLKERYNEFIKTEDGQKWLNSCPDKGFSDYLYEFYHHMFFI